MLQFFKIKRYGTQLGLLDSSLRDTYFNKLCDIHKMIKVLLSKTSKTSKKECYLSKHYFEFRLLII